MGEAEKPTKSNEVEPGSLRLKFHISRASAPARHPTHTTTFYRMTGFDLSQTFRLDLPAVGYGDRGRRRSVCRISHAIDLKHDLFSLDNTAKDDVSLVAIGHRGCGDKETAICITISD